MKAEVLVYTTQFCPYCLRAKSLMDLRGVSYREVMIDDSDDAAWDAMVKKSGMKTVPQIWMGEKLIGGYTDLAALDRQDGLASLK
jgi:glutaredoxin 3